MQKTMDLCLVMSVETLSSGEMNIEKFQRPARPRHETGYGS